MAFFKKQKVEITPQEEGIIEMRNFFDLIAPNAVDFFTDYFVCGNTFRCVWSLVGFEFSTENLAILSELSSKEGIQLHIRHERLTGIKETQVIDNAQRKNKQGFFSKKDREKEDALIASRELSDMLQQKRTNKEPLFDVSIFIEIKADSLEALKEQQAELSQLFASDKIEFDKMLMCQREGFLAILPGGKAPLSLRNKRIYPASSVGNFFPLAYTGKLDEKGFRLGKDKYGGDIIADLEKRTSDKTNSHCLILGNSGEGKSYLAKILLTFVLESGKNLVIIDPSGEYEDIVRALDGAYIDVSTGYIINPLEVRDQASETDLVAISNTLSRHISFLRNFFSQYKAFTGMQLDTIEIMLKQLYKLHGITDETPQPKNGIWPTMADLYEHIQKVFSSFAEEQQTSNFKIPITEDILREVMLSLESICIGADSKYFNGVTNIPSSRIVAFCFKHLIDTNENLLSATLFNALSFMHNSLVKNGHTVGLIDELHIFLKYPVAVNYIRADIKTIRKNDSYLILATQNIEDFNLPGIKELTKPLFTIPTHSFLFYPGKVNVQDFIDLASLTPEEYALIRQPNRGSCLYKCGSERFLLQVEASPTKAKLIGKSGGR